ncbi:MAG: VWA domain-containing protein [Armatimonadota bacterium]|nr:VWA domain-containing protein [bacterium]MDW8319836.1 VWA domain-containing protein [Armatimonadota bacterium]
MPVEFARPWMLLLLAVLPAFWWLHRHSLAALPRWQKQASLWLRLLLVTLIIFALAGIRWVRTTTAQAVFFVVDGSASVEPQQRETALQFIRNAVRNMREDDMAGIIVFGGDPQVVTPLSARLDVSRIPASSSPDMTDIGRAISLALAAFPESVGKQVVLFSDGNANTGDTLSQALQAASRGVKVHVVPFAREVRTEALVERVQAPTLVKEGEPFDVRMWIQSTHEQSAEVTLLRDGQPVKAQTVTLKRGKNLVRLTHREDAAGQYRYQVSMMASIDTYPQNNRGAGYVRVQGTPRVLYVTASGKPTPLSTAAQSQRIRVDVVNPQGMKTQPAQLQAYDAVILHNVPAYELGIPTMRALQIATREMGIGLGMIGGENSFGAGGYFETPVEEALPVSMDVRKYHTFPSVGIVLVVDDSGSMAMPEGGTTKMELANRAAATVVRFLTAQDEVGVIAAGSDCRAVVPMWRVGEKREEILRAIAAFQPGGGGIYVRPGMEAGAKLMQLSRAKLKHMIVLADGDDCDDTEGAIPLAAKLRQAGITVTVVCFGRGKDEAFLQQLAKAGGGRYYFTDRMANLPQIFTKEAVIASKAQYIEEPFYVRYTGDEIVSGLNWDGSPPLLGYNTTTAKPGAQIGLLSHKDDPIFAVWQYGVGRSMAFTSDGRAKWCAQWVRWTEFPAFAARTLRTILRSLPAEDLRTQVSISGGKGYVSVDLLRQPAGEETAWRSLSARLISPTGQAVPLVLSQTGATRYEASFDARNYGTYVVAVQYRRPDGTVGISVGTDTVAYSPEYRDLKSNKALLEQIARVTGGRQQPSPQDIFGSQRAPVRVPSEASIPLLFVVLFLLPVDIALRRIVWQTDALPEWQQAWARTLARLHLKREAPAHASATSRLLQRKERLREKYASTVASLPTTEQTTDSTESTTSHAPTPQPSTSSEQIGRLLDAKRRARKKE